MKRIEMMKKGITWLLTTAMLTFVVSVMAEPIFAQATTKTIEGLGTDMIIDPTLPKSEYSSQWKGNYVYLGNYDADGDGTAEPVKYRVLDARTADFSSDGKVQTMFLDCDTILYYMPFDSDGVANAEGTYANNWSVSDVKKSLNGTGFLNKEGVFTGAEKNAIAASNVASHPLTMDSTAGVAVEEWSYKAFENYVALTGEQVFLLDVEDIFNSAYGYTQEFYLPRKKQINGTAVTYWLRSAQDKLNVGVVSKNAGVGTYKNNWSESQLGISPALNLKLDSVLFASLIFGNVGETGAEYKLTLLDNDITIAPAGGVTKNGNVITIPYTISGSNKNNASQVSVLVLDKEYTVGNTNEAKILDYQKLNVASFSTSGSGTYTLPESLSGKSIETDYHVYILAEDVNEETETDYASQPYEVEIFIDTVKVPGMDAPIAEKALGTGVTLTSEGIKGTPTFAWKKVAGDTEKTVTGSAEWKTTYKLYMTLTSEKGYSFTDVTGKKTTVTFGGSAVSAKKITVNGDGILTVLLGEYTTATRKLMKVKQPEVSEQFDCYYTAENVLKSTEFDPTVEVTLEGTTEPNTVDMEVEWQIVDAEGNTAAYDETPSAYNTFKWTIKPSEYAQLDVTGVAVEGTITIQNKRYIPEVVAVPTAAQCVYSPSKTLADIDLVGGKVKDVDGTVMAGTWSWKENGALPTVDNKGYEVVFTPNDSEHYEPISGMATVKVTKATPVIVTKPVAGKIVSGKTLKDATLTGGMAQYSTLDKTQVKGTFAWVDAGIKPAVSDSGKTQYKVVFTPSDSVNYTSAETTVTVTLKAPQKGAIAKSSTATYKVTKSAMKNGTVTYVAPINKKATKVTIPETVTIDGVKFKVTAIANNAFKNCTNLRRVTIGKNVKTIGKQAFYGCKKLKNITIKTTKLTSKRVGKNAFKGIKSNATIKVPKKKFKAYKSMLIKKGVNKKAKFKKA